MIQQNFDHPLNAQAAVYSSVFVVESVPGGFIVTGSGGRQVARNVHAVGRLLREWAPKEPKKETVPE
jgi:hypothetical protein